MHPIRSDKERHERTRITCSLSRSFLLSHMVQGALPREGCAHSGLALPTPINKDMPIG